MIKMSKENIEVEQRTNKSHHVSIKFTNNMLILPAYSTLIALYTVF